MKYRNDKDQLYTGSKQAHAVVILLYAFWISLILGYIHEMMPIFYAIFFLY